MSFLPGMFPAGAAAVARLATITQVLSATSTTAGIVAPVGIRAGDVIFILDFATNTSGIPGANVPSGFTNLVGVSTTGITNRLAFYGKVADGTEGGATFTGMSGTSANRKVLAVFRGNAKIVAMNMPVAFGAEINTANPAVQNVPSGSGTPPLIVFGGYGATGAIDPRSFTPAKDGELNSTTNCYLAWKIYNRDATPANISVDMDDEGTNVMVSGYMELS